MISFWEKQSFLSYDYIIVGSGIVGLATAATLKERQPNKSILILERGLLPTGASTKNAGFACIGSLTELLDNLSEMPAEKVVNLVAQRLTGLQKLRQRFSDQKIGYQELGSYELLKEDNTACLNRLEEINQLLFPVLQGKAFSSVPHLLTPFGFSPSVIKGIIANHFEGQLDTGKLMKTFLEYVTMLGVTVLTGARVEACIEDGQKVLLRVQQPYLKNEVTFQAQQVAICTNAFTKKLLPTLPLSILPGRGQVLVTQPIANLPFKGIFHFDSGYYYFRTYQKQLIFGGGRNLDFEREKTSQFGYNEVIFRDLEKKLRTIILPNTPFKVAMKWAGIMAFGQQDKTPVVKKISDTITLGVRLNGMGIAIGSLVGEKVAQLMLA